MKIAEASEALQRIGLSRYEALVFVNLARAGATTAGDVAPVSGVDRAPEKPALGGAEARRAVEITLDPPPRHTARGLNGGFAESPVEKRSQPGKADSLWERL